MNEEIVKFFSDRQNKSTVDRMRQMLGQQRKREEYLNSERVYNPREERAVTKIMVNQTASGKEEK
jgi:hypothetical protein